MNRSGKVSPLKTACLSATHSISTAEDLVEDRISPNSIDDFDIPTIIRSLQALRHKAMINDKNERQKKCESLISELNFKLNSQSRPSSSLSDRKKSRKVSSRQTPIKGDSLSNFSSLQPDDASYMSIELTDEESKQMNNIIDSLLRGCEIESIDQDIITKLKYALKQRKKHYIDDGNYLLVKEIDEQLLYLTKSIKDYEKYVKNIQKINNHINEANEKLKQTENTIQEYKRELEEELTKIEESKDMAKAKLFKEMEDNAKMIEEETNEVDLGFNFKPSGDLLDMRSLERKYVITSRYEEAAELRKNADKIEAEERKAYDQNARAAIDRKEMKKRKEYEQNFKKCEDYYGNIREKTIKKYNKMIEISQFKIKTTSEEIEKLKKDLKEEEDKKPSIINANSDNDISIYNNSDEKQILNTDIDNIGSNDNDNNDNYNNDNDNNDNDNNDDEYNIDNNNDPNFVENNSQNSNKEDEMKADSMSEQEFLEHEKHIYSPFNSKLPDSSTSPIVGVNEMTETDQNMQTTPVVRKKKIVRKVAQKKRTESGNDNSNKNIEPVSEIKIDANNVVQTDQEAEEEKPQNDTNEDINKSDTSSSNQPKTQAKTKRTKKVVKKVVKKAPKKSS